MNHYLNKLKDEVESKLKPLAEKRDTLVKQREALQKKIEDTTSLIERLRCHGEDLGQRAGASLLGGQNEYAKFQTSLRKNVVDIETAQRELVALQTALEQTRNDFTLAERNLNDQLKALARDNLRLVQDRINALLDQICAEYDGWILAWDRICQQYGESFSSGRLDLTPSIQHERIGPKVPGRIVALPWEERAARLKAGEANR